MFTHLTPKSAALFRAGIAAVRAAADKEIAISLLNAVAKEFGVPDPLHHPHEYQILAGVTFAILFLPVRNYAESALYDGAQADAEDIAMVSVCEIIGIPDSTTVYDRTKGKSYRGWAFQRAFWHVLDRNKRVIRDRKDKGEDKGADEGEDKGGGHGENHGLLDALKPVCAGAEYEDLRARLIEESVAATCRAFPKMPAEGPEFLKAFGEGIFLGEWSSGKKTKERKGWDDGTYDRYRQFHSRHPEVVAHFRRELLSRVAGALGETFE